MQRDFTVICDKLASDLAFNGNILIAARDHVLLSQSFGQCFTPDEVQPLDAKSIFELASVSKQFTAFATLLAFEQQKMALSTPVDAILPGFPYAHISVKNLLNHTSGLPDYMLLFDEFWDKTRIATNQDVLRLLTMHAPSPHFEPGTSWEYSNTGYVVLALVLEKITQMPFAEYLQKAVFEPLNMADTFVYNRRLQPQNIDNYAFGVIELPESKQCVLPDALPGYEAVYFLDGIQGDGTVNAPMEDLLRWNNAILDKKLLSEVGYRDMMAPTTCIDGTVHPYGYGWCLSNDPEFGHVAFHGGSWPGYSTYNSIYLDKGISIIFLCNKPSRPELEQQIILDLEEIVFAQVHALTNTNTP
jgi:CubicO group peptidase (beta-lactamase class C family)